MTIYKYPYSGENLEAITRGLNIQKYDEVLSICGSGAQPLAILEHIEDSGKVIAIDYKEEQLNFAKIILNKIIERDYEYVINADIAPRHEGYFSNITRLEKIAANSHNISFSKMDVTEEYDVVYKFTKGYLSNTNPDLKKIHKFFRTGSIIYLSTFPWRYDKEINISDSENYSIKFKEEFDKYNRLLKGKYVVDKERTMLARILEEDGKISFKHYTIPGVINTSWKPVVLVVL